MLASPFALMSKWIRPSTKTIVHAQMRWSFNRSRGSYGRSICSPSNMLFIFFMRRINLNFGGSGGLLDAIGAGGGAGRSRPSDGSARVGQRANLLRAAAEAFGNANSDNLSTAIRRLMGCSPRNGGGGASHANGVSSGNSTGASQQSSAAGASASSSGSGLGALEDMMRRMMEMRVSQNGRHSGGTLYYGNAIAFMLPLQGFELARLLREGTAESKVCVGGQCVAEKPTPSR